MATLTGLNKIKFNVNT